MHPKKCEPVKSYSRVTLVVPLVVLAAATLFSADKDLREHLGLYSGPLRSIVYLLTLPLAATNPDDIRRTILPFSAGLLLIVGGIRFFKTYTVPAFGQGKTGTRNVGPAFINIASACLFFAAFSATYNDTWLLSRGWMWALLSACIWAAVLARWGGPLFAVRALDGAIAVGAFGCALALWHRQETNLLYVDWPIGPLTACAAVAATIGTLAAARIICLFLNGSSDFRKWLAIGLHSIALALSVTTLIVSERTGPWLGMVGGVGLIAAAALLKRYNTKIVRIGIFAAIVVGLLLVLGFVWKKTSLPESDKARSFSVRLIYWKKIVEEIPKSLVLGVGPDMFMPRMTTLLARQRAETPHVLHGYIDTEAHNEWLQAVYELGLIGGLLYVAIPFFAIIAALRAWWKSAPEEAAKSATLPIVAGLAAILIIESASINLRHATLSTWYWTLVGLALACGSIQRTPSRIQFSNLWVRRVVATLAITFGIAFLYFTTVDINRGAHHAQGRNVSNGDVQSAVTSLSQAHGRFGAWKCLDVEYDHATMLNRLAEKAAPVPATQPGASALPSNDSWRRAVAAWREVDRICPAFLDTGSSFARALYFSGDVDLAIYRLLQQLDKYNPYDPMTNLLYLHIANHDGAERLDLVAHALREADLDPNFARELNDSTDGQDLASIAKARAEAAVRDMLEPDPLRWRDPLAPEVLRIAAQLAVAAGDRNAGARLQIQAAECYKRLRDAASPMRRRVFAEVDAGWKAAFYSFHPDGYQRTYEMICEAEQLLANELAHDKLRIHDPELGFIGGEIMPRELQPKFEDMWRFSAAMHLVQGRRKAAALRLSYALASRNPTEEDIRREQRAMAKWLVDIYVSRPESQRPATYEMIRQLSAEP